jgi:hypothetical protein
MFKESEDKYTRIHGMEIRRWLRCEITREVKEEVRWDFRSKETLGSIHC